MFKKFLSVVLLSSLALSAFAAPDPIETDLTAAIARAQKIADGADAVRDAEHIRALKYRIQATEMAVRRLKTRLTVTKDADAKSAISARIEELEALTAALTAETLKDRKAPEAEPAAEPVAAVIPNVAAVGNDSPLSGVWVLTSTTSPVHGNPPMFMVINTAGKILTAGGRSQQLVQGKVAKVFPLIYDGDPSKYFMTTPAPDKLVFHEAAEKGIRGGRYTWKRVTSEVPPEALWANNQRHHHLMSVGFKNPQRMIDFIKANPLKK